MSLRIALTHVLAWPETRRGGERYLHELAAALAEAGHAVTVVTTSPAPRRDRVLGVEVTYLRRRRLLRRRFGELSADAAFGAQALAYLAGRRLDVWHALGTCDAAAAAWLGSVRRVRSVYTNLGIPLRAWWNLRPDRGLHERVVERADHYVCLSKTAGACLSRDYGREPVVIGGGVDVARFVPATHRSSVPVVLFAGAVDEPRKNLPLLVECLTVLRRHEPKAQLWISGPGDRRRLFRQLAPHLRDAVVDKGLGGVEEVGDLYGRAWVTVLPSSYEAFGLVLVEALACGTPIVALEGGGPAELVEEEIGFRCRPTSESLAAACAAAFELATRRETVAACRAAAAEYDWRSRIVPRFEALYHESA